MTTEKVYASVAEARNALCLDTGFDPFLTGHVKGRCTKKALADLGYIVDAKIAAERAKEHRCAVCQVTLDLEYDGARWEYPRHCRDHRKYCYQCDNGHKWYATEAEDKAAGHRCPECGEYWQ
jgi:hypothetical protein